MKKKTNKTKLEPKKSIETKNKRKTNIECPICKCPGETLQILDSKYYNCFHCGTAGRVVFLNKKTIKIEPDFVRIKRFLDILFPVSEGIRLSKKILGKRASQFCSDRYKMISEKRHIELAKILDKQFNKIGKVEKAKKIKP